MTVQDKPYFECGHVCTWREHWWVRSPRAKFYCGECRTTRRIDRFPWVNQIDVWGNDQWSRPPSTEALLMTSIDQDGIEQADAVWGDLVEEWEHKQHRSIWLSEEFRMGKVVWRLYPWKRT